MKSAVLARQGDAVRFNPKLLELAGHYRFEPRPVAVARGNEKGRVERLIRYVRSSFFEARHWTSLEDLNHQATEWTAGVAAARPWPQDKRRTVRDVFIEEQPKLLALPADAFPADERVEVCVGKTPYVRFDLDDYSVPHQHVRRTLLVVASLSTVRILDGANVIATHTRSWDRAQQIEHPEHLRELTEAKSRARTHRGMNRLLQVAPSCHAFLPLAAERGANPGRTTQQLLELLDAHGAGDFEEALVEVLERDRVYVGAVRHVLDRNRAARGQLPPVSVRISPARHADLVVKPHDLGNYDRIDKENTNDKG